MLVLRNFYLENALKYDDSGKLETLSQSESWTLCHFQIHKAKIKNFGFELQGKRLALGWDQAADQVKYFRLTDLTVQVHLSPASISEEKLEALKKAIFVDLKLEPDQVPDYWRDLVVGNVEKVSGKDGKKHYVVKGMPDALEGQSNASRVFVVMPNGEQVYLVGGDVTPPKAVSQPDPEYSELARQSKYQPTGVLLVTIDRNGQVARIQIKKPCGLELDENAVEVVRRWKFKPATLDGKPVSVVVNVEISFRLG